MNSAVIVQAATLKDCFTISELGIKLWQELGYPSTLEYNPDSVLATCTELMEVGVLLSATSDGRMVGFAGGIFSPVFFNRANKVLSELFWWVDPDFRKVGVGLTLLQRFEDAAVDGEAKFVAATIGEEAATGTAGRMFDKSGYRPIERVYLKEVSWERSAQ